MTRPARNLGRRGWWKIRTAMMGAAILCLLWPSFAAARTARTSAATRRDKARQVLAAAVGAMGGTRWLNLRTWRTEGDTASFFQGHPTGEIQNVTVSTALPNKQRFDFGRKGRVVHIYTGDHGWEITYKGKKPLPKAKVEEYRRWRDHSLGTILRKWHKDSATVLLYDGSSMVERHNVDRITLINSDNDAVTIEISTESHLPLRLSFEWRDPRFGDKSRNTVEYDNYESVDGFATPFTITRTVNGEIVWERFLRKVIYNVALPSDSFNPDIAAAHLK